MSSRCVLALTLTLVCCLGSASFGERQATRRATAGHLLGVWDLVSYEDHDKNGKISYGWGQHPTGALTYSPGGRMAVQFMRDPRSTFTAGRVWSRDNRELLSTAQAAEIRDAYTGYYAYFGTYDFDERAQAVTHHITASLRSHEVGADNVRPLELKGDQIVMRIPVTTDTGEARTRFIVWRRAERFEP